MTIKLALQIVVKAIDDIASLDSPVLTLLIFNTYF
jgi:hypothetical protein